MKADAFYQRRWMAWGFTFKYSWFPHQNPPLHERPIFNIHKYDLKMGQQLSSVKFTEGYLAKKKERKKMKCF
jgi:hypothetical protein